MMKIRLVLTLKDLFSPVKDYFAAKQAETAYRCASYNNPATPFPASVPSLRHTVPPASSPVKFSLHYPLAVHSNMQNAKKLFSNSSPPLQKRLYIGVVA